MVTSGIVVEGSEGDAYGSERLLEFLVFGAGLVDGGGVGVRARVGVTGGGILGFALGRWLAGGKDGVFARVPDQQAAGCVGGGFDEVVLNAMLIWLQFQIPRNRNLYDKSPRHQTA